MTKLLAYKPADKNWGAVHYPLDTAGKGWIGLSEITAVRRRLRRHRARQPDRPRREDQEADLRLARRRDARPARRRRDPGGRTRPTSATCSRTSPRRTASSSTRSRASPSMPTATPSSSPTMTASTTTPARRSSSARQARAADVMEGASRAHRAGTPPLQATRGLHAAAITDPARPPEHVLADSHEARRVHGSRPDPRLEELLEGLCLFHSREVQLQHEIGPIVVKQRICERSRRPQRVLRRTGRTPPSMSGSR